MNRVGRLIPLGLVAFLFFPCPLRADYTVVLKNGRRITVESYREEAGMIKFRGLGGEIGISKDQVQSISKEGVPEAQGLRLPTLTDTTPQSSGGGREEKNVASSGREGGGEQKAPAGENEERPLSPEEQRAKEEREYQQKIAKITEQLKASQERYSVSTRGTGGPDPSLLNSEEAIRARTEDLNSRVRDVQYNPAGPSDAGNAKLQTPSSFSGVPPETIELKPGAPNLGVDSPPPQYSGKEKELSDLRSQIVDMTKQREKLIEEMRQKNFNTGNLFLQ